MNNIVMNITHRILGFGQSALKSYGPSALKRILWDEEYSGNKWDFADHTESDCIYSQLQKHAANGSILDLGCGTGNTANEIATNAYEKYLGIDISEICLSKARRRSQESGRAAKNQFMCGDFLQFSTEEKFDVILLRESLYHFPIGKIEPKLNRYAKNLKDNGVFIVRLKTLEADGTPKARPTAMIGVIENEFDVVENCHYREFGSTVIVFRPKSETDANGGNSTR
jgi:2-polyprenyl-3-methyl-5-hydroxy-6-metoxy-1,4-benzoquinol methylase